MNNAEMNSNENPELKPYIDQAMYLKSVRGVPLSQVRQEFEQLFSALREHTRQQLKDYYEADRKALAEERLRKPHRQ